MFNSVQYNDLGGSNLVAAVNRQTGDLYVNRNVWDRLNTDEREFVLLHEQGHLYLDTKDEYEANRYAITHYLEGTLKDDFGRKLQVMSSALDVNNPMYDFQASGNTSHWLSEILSSSGSIMQGLSNLGVGSRARVKEEQARTEGQVKMFKANQELVKEMNKGKNKTANTIIMVVVLVAVFAMVFFLIKSKK